MNIRRAYDILETELRDQGYRCRLDVSHPHPRMYVSSNGQERFTILSNSANYDEGNLLNKKRQDIRRDVLPNLPKPEFAEPAKKVKTTETDNGFDTLLSFPITVFLTGKGNFAVRFSKTLIPGNRPYASLSHTESKHLVVSFNAAIGTKPTFLEDYNKDVTYYFKRANVPFEYTTKISSEQKTPQMLSARFQGGSLTCMQPISNSLLNCQPTTTKKTTTKAVHCLEDGVVHLEMLHEWLKWAKKTGYSPKLSLKGNKLSIEITEKITRKL